MTKVQFIKTSSGEELAVLPRDEFERLTALAASEDTGTARIVRKARAAVAAGDELLLPKIIVDRLTADENPIRILREWREMTQSELALRTEITQGYLSDLEAGKRKGPMALHQKIARSLGVPITLLLPIVVSDRDADPTRFAEREATIKEMRQSRRRR